MKIKPDVHLKSPALHNAQLTVRSMSGREQLAQPFEFNIEFFAEAEQEVDVDALLWQPATIELSMNAELQRSIHGMIDAVDSEIDAESSKIRHRLRFVPRLAALGLNERLEVYVSKALPDIIRDKFQRAGLQEEKDFVLRLYGTYDAREFVVQYKETDLQFLMRLGEHYGISFFFDHSSGRDVVVFTDETAGFADAPNGETASFCQRQDAEGIYQLSRTRRAVPNSYRVADYNYRKPQLDLTAGAQVSSDSGGESYEFGPNATLPAETKRIADVRAEQLKCTQQVYEGASDVMMQLSAGAKWTIDGLPSGKLALLATNVVHHFEQAVLGVRSNQTTYSNTFGAIPAAVCYRPPRTTPKPRVSGLLTGIIDASDKGNYAEIDEEGRYRVRFLFDASGAADGHASHPIRMAQPHAGNNYGMHFPLRPGVEVVIACMDGDPDRPVIVGCVPNAFNPSPVVSGNNTRNVIRTGGSNEINMDDTDGGQRIKMTTPFKNTCFQLGSPNAPEEGVACTTDGHISSSATSLNSISTIGNSFTAFKTAISGNTIQLAGRVKFEIAASLMELLGSGAAAIAACSEQAAYISQQVIQSAGTPTMTDEQAKDQQTEDDTKMADAKKILDDPNSTPQEKAQAQTDYDNARTDYNSCQTQIDTNAKIESAKSAKENADSVANWSSAIEGVSEAAAGLFNVLANIKALIDSAKALAETILDWNSCRLKTYPTSGSVPVPGVFTTGVNLNQGDEFVAIQSKAALVSGSEEANIYSGGVAVAVPPTTGRIGIATNGTLCMLAEKTYVNGGSEFTCKSNGPILIDANVAPPNVVAPGILALPAGLPTVTINAGQAVALESRLGTFSAKSKLGASLTATTSDVSIEATAGSVTANAPLGGFTVTSQSFSATATTTAALKSTTDTTVTSDTQVTVTGKTKVALNCTPYSVSVEPEQASMGSPNGSVEVSTSGINITSELSGVSIGGASVDIAGDMVVQINSHGMVMLG